MDSPLAIELRKNAATFDDAARDFDNNPYIAEKLKLAGNITTTLAHLIGGNGFKASFGPPGDWGYKAAIGNELRKVYDGEYVPGIIPQEAHLKELINHVAILNLAINGRRHEFRLMANASYEKLSDDLVQQIEETEKLMMERIRLAMGELCSD